MEENESKGSSMDAEQHMLSAVHHLVKALGASKNLSHETKRTLADIDLRFSTITKLSATDAERTREVEYQLNSAQKKIVRFQPNQFKIESHYQELLDYLQAIDEVQRLREVLARMASEQTEKLNHFVNQAHKIMQIAMEKLQEVLINILDQSKQSFEYEYLSFHSCEENFSYEESLVSTESDSVGSISRRESSSTESEVFLGDIVHPEVVRHLKSIAKKMFSLQYHQEFCQAFVSFWRYALDEYLTILNIERLSIEDVLKMEWNALNCKIKKWLQAVKSVIGFYLVSQKGLFDQVLGSVSTAYFNEATKYSVLCLLNFGHAITMGPHRPERLFCILDMYEVLTNHIQDINALFAEGSSSYIRMEFHKLVKRLGHSAKVIFLGFGNEVASNTSRVPFANGAIPHLTKYVMNYITLLEEYGDTLNLLLEEQDTDNTNQAVGAGDERNSSSYVSSPVARHLHLLIRILEAKLKEKSNLYGDKSLKHIFMMNNVHYIVQKIKYSKIRIFFGDEWIKEHIVKFKQHARSYERDTWSSALSYLKDDDTKAKATLKERCRGFAGAFEEIYKIQTGWYIPNLQLREDLRISSSLIVVHAYRAFVSRVTSSFCEKYIKYTVEELEKCILDLFEGSQKSLSHSWRK